ncbi:MAG TPA: helix-turn-helix domain-containing protein [Candidatus Binataceae bacterium]|nr:helix-turn-helix domain-containing protein [Candidatus Binataceae bacterium]
MARTRPADRIDSMIEAAVATFCEKGYRRTQMADIARRMGVSPGSLYNYVEGKEALFYLALESGLIEPMEEPPELPIRFRGHEPALKRFKELTSLTERLPALQAALNRERAADPRAELEDVTRELYTMIYRIRHLITLVEASFNDLPQLGYLFVDLRNQLVDRLAHYLELRSKAGQFRALANPAATARLIIETIGWFARNRYLDPTHKIDDETAIATVIDFVVHGLMTAPAAHVTKRAHA